MSVAAPLLSVRDLIVRFTLPRTSLLAKAPAITAVSDVSFDLDDGESLGIVGESGCGKSTLGRAVIGLTRRQRGQILWRGRATEAMRGAEMRSLRRDMQIIFQDPVGSLQPRMTIETAIGEALDTHERDLPERQRRERITGIMDAVGLRPELRNRYPHELSGGQAQRVAIARALILNPRLVVCDEPVSALDVSTQAQIINLIAHLRRSFGLALLFISHDLSVVRRVSDRVMVLYLGRVMEITDRRTLFERPSHPYTRALLSAIPVPDPVVERSKPRLTLKADLPSPIDPPSGCVFRTRCPLATERCSSEVPPLSERGPRHHVACHYPQ